MAGGVCCLDLSVSRSVAVAIGKAVTGHSSQAGVPFTATDSTSEETTGRPRVPTTSRPQNNAHAANSHKKLTGSAAAINLLSGKRIVHSTVKIIPLAPAFPYIDPTGAHQSCSALPG